MLDHLQQIHPVLAAQVGRAPGETAGDSAAAVPPSAASDKADEIAAMATFANSSSVLFDAVFVPGGAAGVQQLTEIGEARRVLAEGRTLLAATQIGALSGLSATAASGNSGSPATTLEVQGVLIADGSDVASAVDRFVATLTRHRFPDRPLAAQITA